MEENIKEDVSTVADSSCIAKTKDTGLGGAEKSFSYRKKSYQNLIKKTNASPLK